MGTYLGTVCFLNLLRKAALNGNHNGNIHFNFTNSKIMLSGIEI